MSENPFFCTCNYKFDLNLRLPLVLECGHTFCKTCLELNSKLYQGKIKTCTVCFTSIDKHFDAINPNNMVIRILEFLNNLYFSVDIITKQNDKFDLMNSFIKA
jgi:hypothetical protein